MDIYDLIPAKPDKDVNIADRSVFYVEAVKQVIERGYSVLEIPKQPRKVGD